MFKAIRNAWRAFAGTFGTENYGTAPAYWWPLGSVASLTDDQSLMIVANFACRRNISEDTAHLPFKMLQYATDDAGLPTRTPIEDDTIAYCLQSQPNPFMTAAKFRATMQDWKIGIGNAWAEVVRNERGEVKELWPIHPSRVPIGMAVKKADGSYTFKILNDNGKPPTLIDEDDLFHLYGYSLDGRFGIPVVQMMMNSLGLTSALETFLKKFYENSARPSCVITTAETLSKESRDELRKQWTEAYGGPLNAGKTAVLDHGLEVSDFKSDFKAMEMTDLKKLQKNDIAMAYRMPMWKLQEIAGAQGWSTLSGTQTDYVLSCLLFQIVEWEQETQRQLMKPYKNFAGYPKDIQCHIETKGILRGDIQERVAFCESMQNTGAMSPNERRVLEDMNPVDEPMANETFIQAGFVPLRMAGEVLLQANTQTPADKAKANEQIQKFAEASRLGKLTNGNGAH